MYFDVRVKEEEAFKEKKRKDLFCFLLPKRCCVVVQGHGDRARNTTAALALNSSLKKKTDKNTVKMRRSVGLGD